MPNELASIATFRAEVGVYTHLSNELLYKVIRRLEELKKKLDEDYATLDNKTKVHERLSVALYNETINASTAKIFIQGTDETNAPTIHLDKQGAIELTQRRITQLAEEIYEGLEAFSISKELVEDLKRILTEELTKASEKYAQPPS